MLTFSLTWPDLTIPKAKVKFGVYTMAARSVVAHMRPFGRVVGDNLLHRKTGQVRHPGYHRLPSPAFPRYLSTRRKVE